MMTNKYINKYINSNTKIYQMAFVPAIIASIGADGITRKMIEEGLNAAQYVFDPLTWFAIWMWLMMLMGMLFKYLSLIPSVVNNVIAYVPDLVNTLTAIC